MIQPGQTYRSVTPTRRYPEPEYRRIKVIGTPITIPGVYGFGKVEVVTLTAKGREVRRRPIECSELHVDSLTANGQPRRTGYVLENGGTE
ncbi:hypothetical protein PUR59_00385 [Streptomyces sp. SP18ES09]|uniref:hypothetical protein n=1 Tax=Streptomyces sp. SP18ES09 TaxID=3002532 RepID=UPI002E75BBDE|nr:hypothetical protein [Streptomyces sp. SP18ES09]MEE1813508.1 hypothetical protein [Streptomyces sp. SP18ES09]